METIFGNSHFNVNMIGYSMGGLVTMYMLEHFDMTNINLKNVIFMVLNIFIGEIINTSRLYIFYATKKNKRSSNNNGDVKEPPPLFFL